MRAVAYLGQLVGGLDWLRLGIFLRYIVIGRPLADASCRGSYSLKCYTLAGELFFIAPESVHHASSCILVAAPEAGRGSY